MPAMNDLGPLPAGFPVSPEGRHGFPWTVGQRPRATRAAPRISVVVPSFQQGNTIEETIRSILLQGYAETELIVVDGGSTDETTAILRRYEPWIAYWVSERDRGQAHAIN
jgi:cellulose synthase/poly-beta-1,6-N-acetylglucosamine synthase-like glycosyltransferase